MFLPAKLMSSQITLLPSCDPSISSFLFSSLFVNDQHCIPLYPDNGVSIPHPLSSVISKQNLCSIYPSIPNELWVKYPGTIHSAVK